MAKHPTLLQHFRSFAHQNKIGDFDTALAYFSVFGGTGWDVDISKHLDALIEERILSNYAPLHDSITRYTHGNALYHLLLSILARGEEYENDVFQKARVGRDKGKKAIDYLTMKSLLKFDLSVENPLRECDEKSDRILFDLPFMRFWFAMVSPNYKSISSGDFSEFRQKWQQHKSNFPIMLSNLLVRELVAQRLAQKFADDPVISIGSYYDKHTHIELLAKRKSGKLLAGACKYSEAPAKPNMLETLKKKCLKAELDVSDYVLFSKNGFTHEVEETKESNVVLWSATNLSSLLENLSKDNLLTYKNKKY